MTKGEELFRRFLSSLNEKLPPENLHPILVALWHEFRNDWHTAHSIVQNINSSEAAWVHAYLHRREGDSWNAEYWYNRAGKKFPKISLDEERDNLTRVLLQTL